MILVFFYFFLPSLNAATSKMIVVNGLGNEFLPINPIELLSITWTSNRLRCAIACHEQCSCRTFDYDLISLRCRLFEGDLTTGSIVTSSLSQSIVMSIEFSSEIYSSIHNQPCETCLDNRYEQCSNNLCQCPPHTFWNGSQCLLQLFENQTCTQADACRQDLNLTCLPCDLDTFTYCAVTTLPVGTTVAGACNGTSGSTNDMLNTPRGIAIINNSTTLIVAEEGNKRVQSFDLFTKSRNGSVLMQFSSPYYPSNVMTYNNSLYVGIPEGNMVQVWPSNFMIPPSPSTGLSCSSSDLTGPAGISVDSNGSIYVASQTCHWIGRWTGSNIEDVAGIINSPGGSNTMLFYPAGIFIDQQQNALYIADFSNHRIQKFNLDGTNNGITVAGGNGPGSAANQLYYPLDVYVSKLNGAIYVADFTNNRVQRWDINATEGITVAGNPSGLAGVSPVDLNGPFAITADPNNETFLYVSDYNNHRVLRFTLS